MSSDCRDGAVRLGRCIAIVILFGLLCAAAAVGAATPIAAFSLDDTPLNGSAGELTDAEASFNAAYALGTGSGVASTTQARICRALDIPANSSQSAQWGMNTEIDVDDDIGSRGSITFWYRADANWNSGTQRMLLDASQSGGSSAKFFHVSVTGDGRVRFYLEDSYDQDMETQTSPQSVSAGTWKHIAVTWDMPADTYRIYIDGNLEQTGYDNSSGTIGELQTLYVGDNRSDYHYGGSDNSADGVIDELRVYASVIGAQDVLDDYQRTGGCTIVSTPIAAFSLDDTPLNGTAGEFTDAEGNFNAAYALGTGAGVASTTDARICRALDIPENTSVSDRWGADTGIDVDDDIGSTGAITFWYRGDAAWNSGIQRMLLDASQDGSVSSAKYFHLSITSGGRLRFRFEDSADDAMQVETSSQSVSAGTWKHIGITWDLPNDTFEIYIDGALAASRVIASSGVIGELQTLYVGDNRSDYHVNGSNNSAHGVIDELRIYDRAISAQNVLDDYQRTGSCPASNLPYAEFRFEETAGTYNGAAGEVVDTQGASTSALAVGTGSGVDTIEDGKICRGVDIPENTSQSAKYYIDTGVDLDSELGSTGSITFWYRSDEAWIGGNNRMLFDASEDSQSSAKYFFLELQSNGRLDFRFEDSSDRDIEMYTATQSVAAGTWKHISVTWDLPNDTYKVYIDGALQVTDTENSNGTIGSLETLVFGDNRGNYHPGGNDDSAHGVIDEIRLYNSTLSDAEVLADFNNARTCGSGPPVDADAFSCVASGASANGNLYLQKVNNAFTFDVVALASGGTIETAFASDGDRSVTVELVDASGGAACASRPVLSPAVSQTVTFVASDTGRKAASAMVVTKAYKSLSCRVTDATPSPAVVACSGDTFTVRPAALSLSAPTLNNSGSGGSPKAVAGSHFSLSVTAASGYDGTPKVDSSKVAAHLGAVATGAVSGSFAAAAGASGTATGTTFAYTEVGNFQFAAQGLYDNDFAADSGDIGNGDCTPDFSDTSVGGRFGCYFGNTGATPWVGRFYPADFAVSKVSDGALSDTCTPGGFSYQGQEVSASGGPVFRVTARNSGGATTRNYTGAYEKLATSDFTFAGVSGDATQNGADGVTPVSLSWSTAGTRSLNDNGDGSLDLELLGAGFTWGRATNDLVGPFSTDLQLDLNAVSDADGVAGIGLPVSASPTGTDMRYGRIALLNASGSELQHLQMPMQVEYYAGVTSGFVQHAADSCSAVSALSFVDLDVSDSLAVGETCVWDDDNDSGLGCSGSEPPGMEWEATPSSGAFNLHLRAPGVGNSGVIRVDATVPAHLQYDWSGTGNAAPTARATFGIFNRPSTIIYRREVR